MSASVGEDFPKQQEKCREVMAACAAIGPAGQFAVMNIKAVLKQADEAMASGDLVRILAAYEEMKGIDF